MSDCTHPLDPLDVEALASGIEPPIRPDAAAHAFDCVPCGEAVRRVQQVEQLLEQAASHAGPVSADLADRVLRIRPFSRVERWSLAVWRAPLSLLAGLWIAGAALVAGLGEPREQVGVAAAFAATLAGLWRACARWLLDLSRGVPAGLEALSQLLRPTSVGWAALLLLLPAGLALRTVLARAFSRR